MTASGRTIKKYRWWFAIAFALSFIVLMASGYWEIRSQMAPAPATPPVESGPGSVGRPSGGLDKAVSLVSLASMLTSITSLIGFLITTRISWRKDRREADTADLDLEKKKLELEMLRLDIEKRRKENSSKSSGPTDSA
ncbi:hypothetical protein [Pseudomonas fluorescens]|uniref:hypothetical protein n=1 Tax=Pseudomonas fluorescens TaxID=294 RepID=UPI00124086E4|nr:hypothetical protein [Pseudomonas fluorescens]